MENPMKPIIKLIGKAFKLASWISLVVFVIVFVGVLIIYPEATAGPVLAFLIAPVVFILVFVVALLWQIPKVRKFPTRHQIVYYVVILIPVLLVLRVAYLFWFFPFTGT